MKRYIFKLKRTITRTDSILSFILNGFGLVLMFVQQIVFARVLGDYEFGMFSFIQAIYAISTVFTTWGMGTLSSREIGSLQDLGLKKGFYLFSHLFVMLLNLLMGIILVNISPNFDSIQNLYDIKFVFVFATVYFYLKSFVEILSMQYQAEGQTVQAKLSSHIIPILSSIIVVIIGYNYFGTINLMYFLIMVTLATAISIFFITTIKKPGYYNIENINMTFEFKEWIRSGLFLMLLSGLYIIFGRMNSLIIGVYLEPQHVGYYSVCLSLSYLVLFGLNSFNQVFAPKIAKSYKELNYTEFQNLILKSTKIGFLTTLIFILMIVLFGKFILSLFGSAFDDSYNILVILSFGYFVSTIAGPVGLSLTMTGREKYVIIFTGIAAIINFTLSLLWVNPYGIVGVAWANAIGLVLLNLPLALFVKWKFNYRTYISFKNDFKKQF